MPPRRHLDGLNSFTEDQVDTCIAIYQPQYGDEVVTRDKAREILHNLTGVYQVLARMAQRADERAARQAERGVAHG